MSARHGGKERDMVSGRMDSGDRTRAAADERGMALVIALLVLLVLTTIGAALMMNVNTESRISGYNVRDAQALSIAEAGVQEAKLRLRNGDVIDDGNPRSVTLIFNQVAGSIPSVGTDTTALPTLQPTGAYLSYSSAAKNPDVLMVKYKTSGNAILRYDTTKNPKIQTVSGNPIWVIESTGRQGNATRTLHVEVTRSRINVMARAAIAAKEAIQFKGNINICGHNHRVDTPAQLAPPACDVGIGQWWESTIHGSCLPGGWSEGTITKTGSAVVQGEPLDWKATQTGFYSGPWDALGMTQSDFWAWVGQPRVVAPVTPSGITYLDNDGTKQNASGSYAYNGGYGEGMLYVDGDLQLNGTFNFRGLIYVEGNLSVNGNCWILGGLIVKGNQPVKIANGSATILFSGEAITQKISKYGGEIQNLAWREL
jgi:Tfp pilus assembly protein PilX